MSQDVSGGYGCFGWQLKWFLLKALITPDFSTDSKSHIYYSMEVLGSNSLASASSLNFALTDWNLEKSELFHSSKKQVLSGQRRKKSQNWSSTGRLELRPGRLSGPVT